MVIIITPFLLLILMTTSFKIHLPILSTASSLGSCNRCCQLGSSVLRHNFKNQRDDSMIWKRSIRPMEIDRNSSLIELNNRIRHKTTKLIEQNRRFAFLSGNHSCAIGIWGGVMKALVKVNKRLGIIWIDAHLDAHTSVTSPSSNLHGMPVAALLGLNDPLLDEISANQPIMDSNQIILTGIHSYEEVEKQHLDQTGVSYQLMSQVRRVGLKRLLQKNWKSLSKQCDAIGISIDLDAINPCDAPGVAVPTYNGLKLTELLDALSSLPKPIALEVSEFNPYADRKLKTANSIFKIIRAVFN